MAANVTLAELKTLCRNRGELRAPFITDPELVAMINGAIADIHRLILAHDADRLITSETINVMNGIGTYALNSSFVHILGADLLLDDGLYYVLPKFDFGRRNTYIEGGGKAQTAYRVLASDIMLVPEPDWSDTDGLRVWEVNKATQLVSDTDTWDSVDFWHEFVLLKVQIMACAKSGEDPSVFMALLKDMRGDLTRSINIDWGEPGQVRDIFAERRTRRWIP